MWDYATDSTLYSYNPFPTYNDTHVAYDSGLWTTYGDYAQHQGYYDYGVTTDTSGVMYDSYGNTSADYASPSGGYDASVINTYDMTSVL